MRKKTTVLFALFFMIFVTNTAKASAIFEKTERDTISKGVEYQKIRQVTLAGLRDIFVLTVDITDPYISIGPAESKTDYGLKETVTRLLNDNEAIAGINGDFFGMAGSHSLSFGPVFSNDSLISVTSAINAESNENAALFITNENSPFIMYLKTEMKFFNNGEENIPLLSVNKVTDMQIPIVLNRQSMEDTASIDKRFEKLSKIVVENDVITYISQPGETVSVPENGYLIVMCENTAYYSLHKFSVGQSAKLSISSNMDFTKVNTAIGGGARILLEGQYTEDGAPVASGRHPRSAIGISQDRTKIILVAVDGRTHSIGATHAEMAEILSRFGAYNAMHLDGGGSTTMAVTQPGDDYLSVVNRVSDGSQRKVINAVGVYNDAPYSQPSGIKISAGSDGIIYKGLPVMVDVYAVDSYLRHMDINTDELVVTGSDPNGYFLNGYYYPQTVGTVTLNASYRGMTESVTLECRELKELRPNVSEIKVMEGEGVQLSFTGVDHLGGEENIVGGITYQVVPISAGHVENDVFMSNQISQGYIECRVDGVAAYIPFSVGGNAVMLEPLSGARTMSFVPYPAEVAGSAEYASGMARLNYKLPKSESTQAAYMEFAEPIVADGDVIGFKLGVYGDNSGIWLRGRITDGEGNQHNIDFTKSVDWVGVKTVNAMLPSGVAGPVKLDRIYAVTLSSPEGIEGSLYFSGLRAVYPITSSDVLTPEPSKYTDPLQVVLSDIVSENSFDIAIVGNTSFEAQTEQETMVNESIRAEAVNSFVKNTALGVFTGKTDLEQNIVPSVYNWQDIYSTNTYGNVLFINLSASKGGLSVNNPWQWPAFSDAIKKSGEQHVIIVMDKNPLNFTHKQELEMFVEELSILSGQYGKNIFVVSTDGTESNATIKNGVRFINLGSLYRNEGLKNESFKILKLRVNGNDIRFELVS